MDFEKENLENLRLVLRWLMVTPTLPCKQEGQLAQENSVLQGNAKTPFPQETRDVPVLEDKEEAAAVEGARDVKEEGEGERLPLKEISNNRIASESPTKRKK